MGKGISFKNSKKMTKQSFTAECDINRIIAKAKQNGFLPNTGKQPLYLDCTKIPDYQSSLNIVIEAERNFMSLDPRIRRRFQNNPSELIRFVQDNSNYEEAVKLGLIEKKKEPEGKLKPVESDVTK